MVRIGMVCVLVLALAPAGQAGPEKKAAPEPEVPAAVRQDPNWLMLDHVEAVFALIEANQGDCDRIVTEATAYVEKHKAELKELRRRAQDKSLCPKAKRKAEARIQKRAEKLGEKLSPLMFGFYKKCPDHVDRLHRGAMQFIGSKCKQDGTEEEQAGH